VYDSKARYVRSLFSKVPLEYDLLLGLLSFGQDRKWRAFVVEQAEPRPDSVILDVATGTGLLAADFAKAIANKGSDPVHASDRKRKAETKRPVRKN
jgi:demethylmenaquinone methyltransferase/2-methoxy-6-polyprenyl-1,4-benzoquinol methylase